MKKPRLTFSSFGGWNIWGPIFVLLILAYAGMAKSQEAPRTPNEVIQEALEIQLLGCIANERADWSVIGTAEFVGEPWAYNDRGIPGERLMVNFEDQTIFSYGGRFNGTDHDIWAKNLTDLQVIGMENMPPPYTAIKRADDAIFLLKADSDGTCRVGWFLGYF